jgi:hypothetical protein
MVMTAGVIYFRYSSNAIDSNWPLIYYVFAVLHLQWYPDGLSQEVVFGCILAAMFMRFEFLSGMFLKVIQIIEYIGLLLVGYQLFSILY